MHQLVLAAIKTHRMNLEAFKSGLAAPAYEILLKSELQACSVLIAAFADDTDLDEIQKMAADAGHSGPPAQFVRSVIEANLIFAKELADLRGLLEKDEESEPVPEPDDNPCLTDYERNGGPH